MSARHLSEFGRFLLWPDIRDATNPGHTRHLFEFYVALAKALSDIAWQQFATGDVEGFLASIQQLRSVDRILPNERRHRPQPLGGVNAAAVYDEVPKLPEIDEETQLTEDDRADLAQLVVRQALFGLLSWLYETFRLGRTNRGTLEKCTTAIRAWPEMRELWRVYHSSKSRQVSADFGWDWWEFDHAPEGTVRMIDFGDYLDRAFVFESLEVTAEVRVSPSVLTIIRNFDTLGGPSGRIRAAIARVRGEEAFAELLARSGPDALKWLEEALDNAQQRFVVAERNRVIEAPLSEQRFLRVADGIEKGFDETATVRAAFSSAEAFEIDPEYQSDQRFGFFILSEKDVYIDDTSVVLAGWGDEFGRQLGVSENSRVVQALVDGCGEQSALTAKSNALDTLRRAVRSVRGVGGSPVVIVSGYSEWEEVLRNTGQSIDCPIHYARMQGHDRDALVADLAACAWRQGVVQEPGDLSRTSDGGVFFSIEQISVDEARRMLAHDADFRSRMVERAGSDEGALQTVRAKIKFRLLESFEVQVNDPQRVASVSMLDDSNGG